MYNNGFSDDQWFYLTHKDKEPILIPEPIAWDEGNSSQKRKSGSDSLELSISNQYQYYGDAKDFILDVIYNYNINDDVYVIHYTKNNDGKKYEKFKALLDLSSYQLEDGKLSVDFDKNSLKKKLQANQSKKVELERTTSLDGDEITNFEYEELKIESVGLFLKSTWESPVETHERVYEEVGTSDSYTLTIPYTVATSQHPDDATESTLLQSYDNSPDDASTMFFFQSEEDREGIDLIIDLDFNVSNLSDNFSKLGIEVYCNIHGDGVPVSDRIYNYPKQSLNNIYSPNESITITGLSLDEGESIQLVVNILFEMTEGDSTVYIRTIFGPNNKITLKEKNKSDNQTRRVLGAHYLGERLVEILSGSKDNFYAPELLNGDFKDLKFTSGLYIRGFYGLNYVAPGDESSVDEDENDRVRIQTSFKNYVEYCMKLGLIPAYKTIEGIERFCLIKIEDNFLLKEKIILEKKGYNYRQELSKEDVYSSVKIGNKFADIESTDAMYNDYNGLTSYNALTTWQTEHTKMENEFEIVTDYRDDPVGITLALKKGIETDTTEDTDYDSDIFAIDCYDDDGVRVRKWGDDFDSLPENIYDPESAYNLRLTPRSVLERWKFILSTGLSRSLSVINSAGNTSLKLIYKDLTIQQENEDVSPSGALLSGHIVSFDYPITNDLSSLLNGQVYHVNEIHRNTQCLTRFLDEDGNWALGWVKEVSEGDKIEFKINTVK